MDADQLSRLTLGLYAQTVPLEVCKDAAQEMSPPMRWSEWLEASGTLQRLAEEMAVLPLQDSQLGEQPERDYIKRCRAVGVPAVQIEVGSDAMRAGMRGRGDEMVTVWSTPAPALALATLRNFVVMGEKRAMAEDRVMAHFVRSHHPAASRFRLRIGDSEWTEREV